MQPSVTSADKDEIYQQTHCEITTRGRTRKDGKGKSWTDGRNLQVHGPVNTMEHALQMAWQAIERNGKGKEKGGHGKGCGNGKGGSGGGPDLQKGKRSTKGVDSTTVNDNQAVPPAPPAVSPPPGLEPLLPVLPLDVAITEALQGNPIHVASNSVEATVVEAIRTASWRGYHAGYHVGFQKEQDKKTQEEARATAPGSSSTQAAPSPKAKASAGSTKYQAAARRRQRQVPGSSSTQAAPKKRQLPTVSDTSDDRPDSDTSDRDAERAQKKQLPKESISPESTCTEDVWPDRNCWPPSPVDRSPPSLVPLPIPQAVPKQTARQQKRQLPKESISRSTNTHSEVSDTSGTDADSDIANEEVITREFEASQDYFLQEINHQESPN